MGDVQQKRHEAQTGRIYTLVGELPDNVQDFFFAFQPYMAQCDRLRDGELQIQEVFAERLHALFFVKQEEAVVSGAIVDNHQKPGDWK